MASATLGVAEVSSVFLWWVDMVSSFPSRRPAHGRGVAGGIPASPSLAVDRRHLAGTGTLGPFRQCSRFGRGSVRNRTGDRTDRRRGWLVFPLRVLGARR